MTYQSLGRGQRAGGAAGALAVTGLLGWALVSGLAVGFTQTVEQSLAVFGVAPEPPPPPPVELEPNPVRDDRPEGEAAPPNIRSTPTELVAPPPVIPIVVPPPVIVAEKPGTGSDATQGSAEVPGPGTGAGGVGDGTGSGGAGDGDGGGGETPPLWLRGEMSFSQLPRELRSRDLNNRVGLRYLVGVSGRVEACEIERSSGIPLLDQSTCRIIRDRYRFEPSRDARGRPVPAWIVESHEWVIETVEEDGR